MSKTPHPTAHPAPHGESDAANLARTGHASGGYVGSGKPEGETVSDLGRSHGENEDDRSRYAHDGDRRPRSEGQRDLGLNAPEARVEEARDAVKQRQDKLSAQNEEGHARNMAREEERLKDRKTVDAEDGEIGAPDPKLGREDNGNTPRIAADGTKSWHPPGVAGAIR